MNNLPEYIRFTGTDHLLQVILQMMPNATIEEDNYGQIVIHTGLCENPIGYLVDFELED